MSAGYRLDGDERVAIPLAWLTPQHLFLGLAIVSVGAMVLGTCGLYGTSGPLPPPRPPPPVAAKSAVTSYRYKEGYYRSTLDESAKKVGIDRQLLRGVWRRNRHFAEFAGSQRLKVGGSLETTHLALTATSEKVWVGEEGQGYRTEHLLLKIVNRSDRHLAYRVITEVAGKCGSKGIVNHNAIALEPKEELTRTECIENGAGPLTVKRVEVLELSPIGYYYVSQLDPAALQYERRTAEGHQGPSPFAPCRLVPWREIEGGIKRGDIHWYDVLDFYSRHSCDEYTFFPSYRMLKADPKRLPLKAPDGE